MSRTEFVDPQVLQIVIGDIIFSDTVIAGYNSCVKMPKTHQDDSSRNSLSLRSNSVAACSAIVLGLLGIS